MEAIRRLPRVLRNGVLSFARYVVVGGIRCVQGVKKWCIAPRLTRKTTGRLAISYNARAPEPPPLVTHYYHHRLLVKMRY